MASAQNATLMYIQDGRYSEITLLSAHRSKYKVSFRVARALSSSLSYIACADNVSVASRLTKLCVIGAVDQSPSEQSTVATLRLHCKSSSGVWFWYAARLLCLLLSIIEPAAFGSTDGQSNRPRTVRSTLRYLAAAAFLLQLAARRHTATWTSRLMGRNSFDSLTLCDIDEHKRPCILAAMTILFDRISPGFSSHRDTSVECRTAGKRYPIQMPLTYTVTVLGSCGFAPRAAELLFPRSHLP